MSSSTFTRSSRSIQLDDGFASRTGLICAAVLLAAWLGWAFTSRITRYETTDSARLEVNGAAYPVETNVSGQVVRSHLVLGRDVHAGDILVELDRQTEVDRLNEARAKLQTLAPQLAALRAQMAAEEYGRSGEQNVAALSVEEARAKYAEAKARADLGQAEAERAKRLRAEGLIAEAEAQRVIAEAATRQAAAEQLRTAIQRLAPELAVRQSDRDVRTRQIEEQIAKLEADRATTAATIVRYDTQIERRLIRAATDGRITECAQLLPGTHIAEGQRIAVVLPAKKLQIVAEFAPTAAFGKLHPGQRAQMKLKGFPWMQYGTVKASVTRVAGEIRNGTVRVELALTATPERIPLEHGAPGTVEVEVENISPAALLMRTAGRALGADQ